MQFKESVMPDSINECPDAGVAMPQSDAVAPGFITRSGLTNDQLRAARKVIESEIERARASDRPQGA